MQSKKGDMEEICAVRLESSALPPNTGFNQLSPDEQNRQGQRRTFTLLCDVSTFSELDGSRTGQNLQRFVLF